MQRCCARVESTAILPLSFGESGKDREIEKRWNSFLFLEACGTEAPSRLRTAQSQVKRFEKSNLNFNPLASIAFPPFSLNHQFDLNLQITKQNASAKIQIDFPSTGLETVRTFFCWSFGVEVQDFVAGDFFSSNLALNLVATRTPALDFEREGMRSGVKH